MDVTQANTVDAFGINEPVARPGLKRNCKSVAFVGLAERRILIPRRLQSHCPGQE